MTTLACAVGDGTAARSVATPSYEVDTMLVAAYRGGDEPAFEAIYRLHQHFVHLQACRVLGDSTRAEDVTQEAFIRLTRQLRTGQGEIRLRAWLHRTTTNLAIDEHRRVRSERQHVEADVPVEDVGVVLERHQAGHPERVAEQTEIRATIARVIELLPRRYRRILALRELEGLDYPAIAAAMELSVSAVESLLFRARRRFTEVYRQLTDEPTPRARRQARTSRARVALFAAA